MVAAFMGIKASPKVPETPENTDLQAERLIAELSMFPQPSNQK